MRTYLVGGAVRDELLGLPVTERDWVVLDATPEEMIRRGFKPVGRHFPVFLHPETKEEYALARTEHKTGPGYHGFEFHAGPGVTLEEDLQRRDLTINAIARDNSGRLIDPWGGRSDLDNRILRHVSPAFTEDPVRVLRVARFAARFYPLGFRIAPETLALMRDMTDKGETKNLVAERVWKECETALSEPAPSRFFITLKDVGALACAVEERTSGVIEFLQSAEVMERIADSLDSCAVSSGIEERPRMVLVALAIEMAACGIVADSIFGRLRMPSSYSRLAAAASFCWNRLDEAKGLDGQVLFDILDRTGAFRDSRQLMTILAAWQFCSFPISDRERSLNGIRKAFDAIDNFDLRQTVDACEGNIGQAVREARLKILSQEYDKQDDSQNQSIEDERQ